MDDRSGRKLAHNGYAAVSPHLYSRNGMSPEEAGADAFRGLQEGRAVVGQPDAQAMGDIEAAAGWLKARSTSTGTVGCIGFCSGGRLAYLAAARVPSLAAAVDCWGGAVTPSPRWPTNDAHPAVPIDLTPQIHCPVLGIFGNEDMFPTPQRSIRWGGAQNGGKEYSSIAVLAPGTVSSRPIGQAARTGEDAWQKVFAFYAKHLNVPVAAAVA